MELLLDCCHGDLLQLEVSSIHSGLCRELLGLNDVIELLVERPSGVPDELGADFLGKYRSADESIA